MNSSWFLVFKQKMMLLLPDKVFFEQHSGITVRKKETIRTQNEFFAANKKIKISSL